MFRVFQHPRDAPVSRHFLAVFGSLGLATGAYMLLSGAFGAAAASVFVLPMALVAWLFGWRGSMIAGLTGVLAYLLAASVSRDVLQSILVFVLVLVCVLLAGWARHLFDRAEQAHLDLRQNQQRYRELLTTSRRQTQELALLEQVRAALDREIDLSTVIRAVVEAIAAAFGYTQVSVYLVTADDPATLQLQHQIGYDQVLSRIPIHTGIMGRVVRSGKSILLEDVRSDPGFLGAIEGIVSELAVPLHNGSQVVGVLNLETTKNPLSTRDLTLMEALAQHMSIAVARGQLYAQARESEARFRAIFEHAPVMIDSFTADGRCVLWNLECEKQLGYTAAELRHTTDPFALFYPDPAVRQNVLDVMAKRDGIFRESQVRTKQGEMRCQMWANFALHTGSTIAVGYDITERKRQEEQLHHEVIHDPLTGVFNRRYLDAHLPLLIQRASDEEATLAVVMIDVDHFKRYNDSLGHAAGDQVLIALGECLQRHIRAGDLLCRYGGEEFTLVLPVASLTNALQRMEYLCQQVAAMHRHNPALHCGITLSMGLALYGLHGSNATELLLAADRALYAAKARGRNQVVIAEMT